jgi:hypothetical protein
MKVAEIAPWRPHPRLLLAKTRSFAEKPAVSCSPFGGDVVPVSLVLDSLHASAG